MRELNTDKVCIYKYVNILNMLYCSVLAYQINQFVNIRIQIKLLGKCVKKKNSYVSIIIKDSNHYTAAMPLIFFN